MTPQLKHNQKGQLKYCDPEEEKKMGTENTEKGEKKEEPKNLLDNDTLRKLADDNIKFDFDELTPEQKVEFHSRFVEGDEEGVPTVEEEEVAAKAATETAAADAKKESPPPETPPDPNVKIEPTEEDADKSVILEKLKSEKDANNTLRQRLESSQLKLESLQNSKVPEPPKIEDALDDNLSKQDKWNRQLAKNLNTHADTEIKNIEDDSVATRQSLLYSDVSLLQTENPELQTSKSIDTLDKTYIRFRDGLAGVGATNEDKNEAVNKFFSDAEFRKSKEGEGHLFAINDVDWKNYKMVTQIIGYKRNGGDPKWDSQKSGDRFPEMDIAYYKYKKDNGIIPDPVQKAALDAATKVADQVAENQSKPNLLSPEVGKSSEGIDGMTEQQAEQWLIDHPTPSSPEEVATLKAILKKWSPSSTPQQQEVVF